jgi:hypothetical protein
LDDYNKGNDAQLSCEMAPGLPLGVKVSPLPALINDVQLLEPKS